MLKNPGKDNIAEVVKIAAPCVTEQMLIVLVGMVSVSIIGHLGSDELVASSMTNQLVTWVQCLFLGLSSGATVVIARMCGDGDADGIRKGFNQYFLLSIVLSVFGVAAMLIFQDKITQIFFGNAEKHVLDIIHTYFSYNILTMPATAVTDIINGSVRGVGDNKTPLYSRLMVNLTNIILCYTLVNGAAWLDVMPMGIHGAGIAILCARYANMIFTITWVLAKKSPILPKKFSFHFEKALLQRMLRISIPSALEQVIFQGGFVILQTLLIGFGTQFQGGYQIGGNINGLINAPVLGVNVAMTVLISQALGKADPDRAEKLVGVSRFLVFTVFTALGVLLFFAAPFITRFYTPDSELLRNGTFFARMYGLLVIPLAYLQSMGGVLRGSGDVRYVALTSIATLWIMRIFGVWILARLFGNGYVAVTVGISADYVFRALAFHIRVQRGGWKYIRV